MPILDTGLADRIRDKDVRVIEIAGWKTRSAGSYDPEGTVNHHTAGSSRGRTPSLATVIYGRPDVRGPLAQVLQSREPNPAQDIAYVVAAGRSNNAGRGSWRGISGNRHVGGLEVEHTGTQRVNPARLEIAARINAALAEAPGSPRDARNTCQHFEWTTRKIDFYNLHPWTPATFRARVAYWIGRTARSAPAPAPRPAPVPEEDDMPTATVFEIDNKLWLCDGLLRREIARDDVDIAVFVGWARPGEGGTHIRKATGDLAEAVMRCPVVAPTVDDTLKYYEAVVEGGGSSPLHRILGQTGDTQSSA